MKLLRVIATINPATGGPVEGLERASRVMLELGVEVEVACLDRPGAFAPEHARLPWPVHQLGPFYLGAYAYAPRLSPWLRQNLRDYDAVIIHGNWQYHGFAAARACRKQQIPYFIYPHGMLDPWFNQTYPLKKLKKQLYWFWGEHPVLANARAVLFTSEEECRLARRSFAPYRVREKIIGYGTSAPDPALLDASPATADPAPPWEGRRYFLFLGRIQEKKGLDLLVEAYAGLRARDPGLPDLVIAGPVQQEDYAARIRDNFPADGIHWAGTIEGASKWRTLAGAEALVLPSHQENFGLVVAEALAVGTPVLLSDKVNIWREVTEGGAGRAAPDTPGGARRLLEEWLALSPDEQSAMREAARDVFARHFEIRRATERLVAYLQSFQHT